MIKAASDSQQPTNQTPAVVTPPSFPTHNPAQGNKSFLKNAPVAPVENKPVGIVAPSPANQNAPVLPKFPDPTVPKTFVKANGTKTASDGKNIDDSNGKNNNSKPKKKSNWKMALGVIVLLIVVMGTGTGFYLTQQSQDLRQQADEGDPVECPLAEACPHADGTLITCDDANVMDIVLCNLDERVESCGGNDYCCPTAGGAWTTDMTACTTVVPVSCNDACTDDAECSAAGNVCDPASNKCRLEINPTSEICEEEVIPPISSYHDYADSECRTYGWVVDSNNEPNSNLVHVYVDGVYGTGTFVGEYLADAVRTDLNDANTNITGDHGFDITFNSENTESSILFDGNSHELYVYAIDSQDPVNSNVLIENTPQTITCPSLTDAVSCDNVTGTLTDGTVVDETTELTYEVTYSGGELVTRVSFVIHGNFTGPGWDTGWINIESDPTPTDGIFSSSTTYKEITDLLVDSGYDRQQIIDEGILYHMNVIGPEGLCWGNGQWEGDGESCTPNLDCLNKTITLSVGQDPVACNEDCTSDTECQLTDTNYVCDYITDTCRLDSNLTSTTCQTASNDDDDDNDDDVTTVGCNDICVTNSDCQDTDHICVTTADGSNRCRLTAYTSSESCVIESSGGTTTATTQPSLPAELPESGPEDWLNWLKAGLVTMGIGTALFLLL